MAGEAPIEQQDLEGQRQDVAHGVHRQKGPAALKLGMRASTDVGDRRAAGERPG